LVRFIHTADWQIGKPFGNIPSDRRVYLRDQRVEMIRRIGKVATDQNVDFILVAGDVFDSNLPESRFVHASFRAMGESFSGKWFLLPGNHDAAEPESIWTRIRKQFASDNVVCMDEPKPYRMPDINTVVLPAPLKRRHESKDLTEWFDHHECKPGDIRIGLAHGSLDALSQYREEAPNTIALARIDSAKLDYLALGDWHGTVIASKRACYSGTPEPERFKQNDSGNILLVSIESPGSEPVVEVLSSRFYAWQEQTQKLFSRNDIASIRQKFLELNVPLERVLLRLALSGSLNFDDRALLDSEIEKLSNELFYIETDYSGLLAEPSESDLDEIETSGFVRTAANNLIQMMKDVNNPERETARMALHILYVENKKLDQAKC
jgi:DNA repair exonuclease SbcCD nuclease subunit